MIEGAKEVLCRVTVEEDAPFPVSIYRCVPYLDGEKQKYAVSAEPGSCGNVVLLQLAPEQPASPGRGQRMLMDASGRPALLTKTGHVRVFQFDDRSVAPEHIGPDEHTAETIGG